MNLELIYTSVASTVIRSLVIFIEYIPSFIGGLIILIIGLVLAGLVHRIIISALNVIQLEKFLSRYGVVKLEGRDIEWSEIIAQIVRWTIIIVFLVAALQAWRLNAV